MIAAPDTIFTTMRYLIGYATLALLAVFTFDDPMTLLRFLSGVGVMAMLNMLYYLRIERTWDFLFGIFYTDFSVFTLFWIFPCALVTLRPRSWLTR